MKNGLFNFYVYTLKKNNYKINLYIGDILWE